MLRSCTSIVFYKPKPDSGPDDDDKTQTRTVRNHFEALGYKLNDNLFYYLDHGGQHSEKYWGESSGRTCAAVDEVIVACI